MKKKYSLKGKKKFNQVFESGKRYKGKNISLISLESKNELDCIEEVKVGIVITKKFGKAFKRNKEKRRVKEIIRNIIFEITHPVWMIFRIYEDFESVSYCEKEREVLCLLKKANIIK